MDYILSLMQYVYRARVYVTLMRATLLFIFRRVTHVERGKKTPRDIYCQWRERLSNGCLNTESTREVLCEGRAFFFMGFEIFTVCSIFFFFCSGMRRGNSSGLLKEYFLEYNGVFV